MQPIANQSDKSRMAACHNATLSTTMSKSTAMSKSGTQPEHALKDGLTLTDLPHRVFPVFNDFRSPQLGTANGGYLLQAFS